MATKTTPPGTLPICDLSYPTAETLRPQIIQQFQQTITKYTDLMRHLSYTDTTKPTLIRTDLRE